MDVDAAFKADAQFAHACEPGMRALDDPAMTAQPVVALDSLACDSRNDAALLEEGATAVDVVSLIGVQFVWPTSPAPWFATNWRQGIDQLVEHDRVVPIGAADAHCQRHAVAVHDQMPFAAEFAAIGRVWPGVGAPRGEATLAASRLARLRSSVWARRSSVSNT